MQSKRGELVPVAEVLSDLGGPVAAIRDTSPQALHHFTRFDQVNQLVPFIADRLSKDCSGRFRSSRGAEIDADCIEAGIRFRF